MARTKPTHRRVEITVCGSGRFPFDMLRYDQCCPVHCCPVHGFGPGAMLGEEFRVVTLAMYGTDGTDEPSTERWQSFGWHVLTGAQLASYRSDPSIEAVANLRDLLGATACLGGK